MKFFHLSCLIPAPALHEAMRYLETKLVRGLEVRTVAEGSNGAAEPAGETRGKRYEVPTRALLLDAFKEKPTMTNKEIAVLIREWGRSVKGQGGLLTAMMKRKEIKKTGPAKYQLVATKHKEPGE